MLTLLIDNHPAIIKSGTTFKLTRVNPYFDTTGDYTFEVTLPLRHCPENRAIFGTPDLPQSQHTPLLGQRHPMQLIAPPLTLRGTATITSVTETDIRVQLIAGTGALLNSLTDDDNNPQYIDTLPLGNAWDQWPAYTNGHNHYTPGKSIHDQKVIFCYMVPSSDGTIDPHIMAYGTYPQTDSVCFPVYMQEENIVCNGWTFEDDDRANSPHLAYFEEGDDEKHILPDIDDSRLTPQPYLLDILQRIIRATGYTIGDWSAYTTNPLTNGLFIVNGRNSIKRADALPHWTLKELITQVQNFLGATFTISDDTHTINLIPRPNYYAHTHTTPIPLTHVIDTHTTDIDQKAITNDNAAANITYRFPTDDPQLILPQEVWQNATVLEFLSIGDIRAHFATLTDEEKAASRILYHDKLSGCTYAILHRADSETADTYTYELAEVDLCAPLVQDNKKRSDMTELKIVPAQTVRSEYNWSGWIKGDSYEYRDDYTTDYSYPLITSSSTTDSPESAYSVDRAINDNKDSTDDTTTSDLDTLELAWHGSIDQIYFQAYPGNCTLKERAIPCPISIPYIKDDKSGYYVTPTRLHIKSLIFPPHGPFSLSDAKNGLRSTLGSIGHLLTGAASIDTRVEHQVQFLDDIPLDPTRTLLIAGRRYAIHKLEITITPTGIAPLKTAYLYEIH